LFGYFENQNSKFIQNGNLIITKNKTVEIFGLDNIVVVDTNDALLIMSKTESQKVKSIYEKLEKNNSTLIN
jgi:mannose-1-phosphate guanylyltransferase